MSPRRPVLPLPIPFPTRVPTMSEAALPIRVLTTEDLVGVDAFFATARERYRIHRMRQLGAPKPWTESRIFQEFRFCNLFREDDKVTRWFSWNIRTPLNHSPAVLWATILFRWFNKPETGAVLLKEGLHLHWDPARARAALADLKPLVTGAYMIKTPAGKTKLEGLIECLDFAWKYIGGAQGHHLGSVWLAKPETMEHVAGVLQGIPFLGPFMAYEVVTDLRHTELLNKAPDINTWCNLGPGARRGLARVVSGDVNKLIPQEEHAIALCRTLLQLSRAEYFWPAEWPAWELREVEHWTCEYDKHQRALLGEGRPKQKYNGIA